MFTTRLHFTDDARRRIVRGATQVARLVELTLGPAARTVLIERAPAGPLVGSSGHDVALYVELVCPVEQIGAQAMRNVAWEMSDRWGDGTATVVCLAAALLQALDQAEKSGHDRRALAAALDASLRVPDSEQRRAACRAAAAHHSPQRVADAHVRLYRSL